jgi:hypothetical protein
LKKKILIAVVLCLALVGLIASPVLAAPATTYNVNGLEISAGSFVGTNTNGAHFIANVTKAFLSPINTHPTFYSGILDVLVNYQGNGPKSTGDMTNNIVGGKWTITTLKGTISGIINSTGGSIVWLLYKGSVTGRGLANINLTITGGTGDFASITTGSGTFSGYDIHMSGIYIFGIQVPVITGQLNLSY